MITRFMNVIRRLLGRPVRKRKRTIVLLSALVLVLLASPIIAQTNDTPIEDNSFLKKLGNFPTVRQVEQVARIAKEIGRDVATASEARQIMKIGAWYDSAEEALFHLSLPPNRKPVQTASSRQRLMEVRQTDRLHLVRSS